MWIGGKAHGVMLHLTIPPLVSRGFPGATAEKASGSRGWTKVLHFRAKLIRNIHTQCSHVANRVPRDKNWRGASHLIGLRRGLQRKFGPGLVLPGSFALKGEKKDVHCFNYRGESRTGFGIRAPIRG